MTESGAGRTRLLGILVTFHRVDELARTLERLEAQTRKLDHLLVVDNGSDPEVKKLVGGRGESISYLDAGDNLGPAGGFALGMERLLEDANDEDWIFLLDDDDPPYSDGTFERAGHFAAEMLRDDPDVGCVGVSGGRFDFRSGRVVRIGDEELTGPVPADHVTGGGQPAYRVAAVRQVGVPWAELFFGFEELEFGLRLTDAGYHIYADGPTWLARRHEKRDRGLLETDEVSRGRSTTNTLRIGPPTWRRYYSMRNLIVILRRHEATWTAIKVSLVRGIIKPLVNLPVARERAWRHLTTNLQAIRDGWLGRLGRTIAPD